MFTNLDFRCAGDKNCYLQNKNNSTNPTNNSLHRIEGL